MRIKILFFIFFSFNLDIISDNSSELHNLNAFFDFSQFYIDSKYIELFNDIFRIVKDYLYLTFQVVEKQEVDLSIIERESELYSLILKYGKVIKGYDFVFKLISYNKKDSRLIYNSSYIYNLNTKRPIACILNLNLFYLNDYKNKNKLFIDKLFLILHSTFHGLGFNVLSLNKIFYSLDGVNKQYKIYSPKVLELAKKHFYCDKLEYLKFENNSILHWDLIQLNNDIQLIFKSKNLKISEITLAFFQDLGYYKVNYNMSQFLTWGKNYGCEFLNQPSDKFEEFSNKIEHNRCSNDYTSRSYFSKHNFSNNFFVKINSFSCNILNEQLNSCLLINTKNSENSYCVKSKCILNEGKLNIEYEYNNKKILCTKDKESIIVDKIKIFCPIIEKFCDYRYECKNNCSGRGYCLNGQCICNPKYKGFACEFNKEIKNHFEINKKCNFNGSFLENKCNCYDNYEGNNCENIIIDKGSFSSKCAESIYVKCYTGEYYNYINSSDYLKNKYNIIKIIQKPNSNTINLPFNNNSGKNITNITNATNTTNSTNTTNTKISNLYNCENYCNNCNIIKKICVSCLNINNENLKKYNTCKIPNFLYVLFTCKNLIQKTSNLDYKCLKIKIFPDKNCKIINNENICIYCNTNILSKKNKDYYLSNSKCLPTSIRIKNCLKYEDKTTCSECIYGYKLDSNTCVENLKPCSKNKIVNGFCNHCSKTSQFILKDKCWEMYFFIKKISIIWLLIMV